MYSDEVLRRLARLEHILDTCYKILEDNSKSPGVSEYEGQKGSIVDEDSRREKPDCLECP